MAKRKTRSLNIPAKYPDRADRMILGDGCIFSTDCRKTGLNNKCPGYFSKRLAENGVSVVL